MKTLLPSVCVFFVLGCATEPSAAGPTIPTEASAAKPNILFILTDDQGWPTLGCYGGKVVPTPHLDRLAAEGARLTAAYVTPLCTATRATLLSGQYTARNGMWHVLIDPWYGSPWAPMTERPFVEQYPRDAFTIAKGLKLAGYTTGIMGKWHLTTGPDGAYLGLNPGFAHHYGFDHAAPVVSRDEFEEGGDRGADSLTDQAIDFISKNRKQPWFCFLSHHMIHSKVVAPDNLTQKYRNLGHGDGDLGPNRAVYLAGLESIDRSIGKLLRRLDDLGEAQDTMVVFLSDNGGVDERLEHRSMKPPHPAAPRFEANLREYDNAPLRDGKGSAYEGGVRVPMIVRWPGTVDAGTVIDTPVHAIDVAPTFLDAASAAAPENHRLDGHSLTRLLRAGADESLDDRPLFQYSPFYDFNWGLTPHASVRRGDHKLVEFFGDRFDANNQYVAGRHVELYNLRDDIGERRDLAAAEPDRVATLTTLLHEWMSSVAVRASEPNPHHDADRAFLTTIRKPEWLKTARRKAAAAGDQWNQFRGPDGDGKSDARGLPVKWSEDSPVIRWKVPIHGKGWSSPVVWDDQVWLTTATEDGHEMSVLCIDRESGRIVHDVLLFENEETWFCHPSNSYASCTPFVEAGRIYVHFGRYGTACLDTQTGKPIWTRRDFESEDFRGPASSPVIDGDRLFVAFDGIDVQFLLCLDKHTGKTIWKSDREIEFENDSTDFHKAYSTAKVIDVAGRRQLISPAATETIAYDPETGKTLWRVRHGGMNSACRPLLDHGLVYVTAGDLGKGLFAVRPDGRGDVTDTHVQWTRSRSVPSRSSQLIVGDLLFMISNRGVVSCLDARTGDAVWQNRVPGGEFWSSPVYADGKIWFSSKKGTTVVVEAAASFKLIAENQLDAGVNASPAVAGSSLIMRTFTHLYRLESPRD